LAAKGGPKAAGRAGKKVLLSSVRLIAALGGKREKGVEKNKAPRDDFFDGDDVVADFGRRIELMDRQTRKMEAEKKNTRMATRGGRIVELASRGDRDCVFGQLA
jgi:hypothetical protein